MSVFRKGTGILALAASFGCGQATPPSLKNTVAPSASKCAANSASIMVGDGYLSTICGCTGSGEANGTVFSTPGNLTCHLAANSTVVFFYFQGTVLKHQIESKGPNTFTSSPVSDPKSNYPIRVYAVTLNQAAKTYSFIDAFSGMTGQIIMP